MALTITIEGLGELDNAEATTNWGISGSGGSAFALDNEIYYQGSGSMNSKISSGKQAWLYYNHGSALNFTTTYSGQCVLIWWQVATPGSASAINGAQQGFSVRMGSSTSVYREWRLGGSDAATNGYTGGWQCAVIDPTSTGTNDVGAYNANAVQYIGIHYDGNTASRAENLFVDSIMVGSGIRITGTEATSGAGWQEVVDYCTDRANRAWGFVQEKEPGIFTIYGRLYIGDSTQTATTTLTDSARVFKWGDYEYFDNTATPTIASAIGNGFHGITIEDSASFTTTFQDGVLVGTDNGRSGSTFIGVDNANTTFDLYGGSNASSTTKMYGSTFVQVDGGLNSGNDADHQFYGCSFVGCAQFDPVGAPVIRNCTFAETSDVDAALLWNGSIDIQDSNFIANTTGAGIEHPAQGSFTYTGLTFSGNTNDILYSAAASSGVLTINATGSNPTTSEITNATGNSVNIISSRDIDINVQDSDGAAIEGAQVYIQKTTKTTFTAAAGNTAGNGSLIVNEVVDLDIPASGTVRVFDKSLGAKQTYRYTSWSSKTFTFPSEVTFNCTGGGTGILLQDSVNDFTALNIEEGDTVRNTTDGSWAVVDKITDASNITTTQLQGGSDNTWTSGDTYSFHKLATTLVNGDDEIDIPLFNGQTDASGDVATTYNWGAIGVDLPITVRIRSASFGGTKYKNYSTSGTITTNGYSLQVTLVEDTINNATS